MMRYLSFFCVMGLLFPLFCSCVSTFEIDKRYDLYETNVNHRFVNGIEDVFEKYDEARTEIFNYYESFRVKIINKPIQTPEKRIDLLEELKIFRNKCLKIAESIKIKSDKNTPSMPDLENCRIAYQRRYIELLRKYYFFADINNVLENVKKSKRGVDLELLFALSHNHNLAKYAIKELKQLDLNLKNALEQLEIKRRQAVQLIKQRHRTEVEDVKRKQTKKVIGAIAEALNAMGEELRHRSDTFRQEPLYATDIPSVYVELKSCHSDFECGLGRRCVKSNFSTSGYCYQVVDKNGIPTYNYTPKIDSINIKMPDHTDCNTDFDCPFGFSCDQKSGTCMK